MRFFILTFLLFLLPSQAFACIDINAAAKEELMKIAQIGESRAEQIISFRQETTFYSLDDLELIAGIGPASLAEIKNQGLACVTSQTKPGSHLIDINTASEKELQKIVGIGPALAQGITEARPFYSLEDLTKVNRIGPKTLENIKEQGLAWVDPKLKAPEPVRQEPLQNRFSQPQRTEKAKYSESLAVFLTALGLALFSGGTVLALKKKLKIG